MPSKPTSFCPQRRWKRYEFECPLRLVVQKASGRIEIHARGTSINEGGMLLKLAAAELQVGERVSVEVAPSFACLPVQVTAEVRNRCNSTYGLKFLADDSGSPYGLSLLQQLIRSTAGCAG